MVKSTSFAQRLDPEDLANLMNEFHDICSKVVCRFGGYVAKNLGDGLGAYFGWPESHEHDAERAVLTGLELIEAVKSIYTGDLGKIHVHVGVATGEVVVGDVPRMDSARVQEVFGELPSLAARLQAACPPDAILASAATFELIRAKFVCAKIGRKKLRGFHEYTDVYQVIGPPGRTR
jgi:class 3 adenylate cyclase